MFVSLLNLFWIAFLAGSCSTLVNNLTGQNVNLNNYKTSLNPKNNNRFDNFLNSDKKLVCFYTFTKKFSPHIMENLCTHINVGFFGINKINYTLENSSEKLQILQQITLLKKINKSLKILASVGGANFKGFSLMIVKHRRRKWFIKSVITLLKKFKIDGIDLDWEWPALNGKTKEKIKFTQLLYELRQEFNRHKKKYIISADVSSSQQISELAYYIQYLAEYVDYVNVMCYDYHFYTKWYPFTGYNSALYSLNDFSIFSTFNVNHSINFWIANMMPREKIIMGVPTYGHTYELLSSNKYNLHAPCTGSGSIGKNGSVNYFEVCSFVKQQNATIVFDNISKVPYAYKYPNWISFDNEMSLAHKADYVQKNNLGGIMIFSVNTDDYSGTYSEGNLPLPLTRKIRSILFNKV